MFSGWRMLGTCQRFYLRDMNLSMKVQSNYESLYAVVWNLHSSNVREIQWSITCLFPGSVCNYYRPSNQLFINFSINLFHFIYLISYGVHIPHLRKRNSSKNIFELFIISGPKTADCSLNRSEVAVGIPCEMACVDYALSTLNCSIYNVVGMRLFLQLTQQFWARTPIWRIAIHFQRPSLHFYCSLFSAVNLRDAVTLEGNSDNFYLIYWTFVPSRLLNSLFYSIG